MSTRAKMSVRIKIQSNDSEEKNVKVAKVAK
jgi:hypothetical protein